MAHANYVKSSPASDARLARAPSEIRITFSETPDAAGSDIAVLDTSGARVNAPGGVASASDESNTLRVPVSALPEGGYLVAWTARSAVDGHETKGAFAFAVGNAPLPAIPDVGPSTPPPAPLELVGRALSFAGIAITLGVAFFGLFVSPATEPAERRRERLLITIGGGLLVAGSVLLLLSYGAGAPARLVAFVLLRALAGVIAIVAIWLPDSVSVALRREAVAFAGLAAGLWATLVSHAAASADPKLIALDFIHIIAISVWSGGVVALLVLALASSRDLAALGATVWRFSLTALVCVAIIVTTGTLQALDRLVILEDLYETPYGIALLIKIALLVVLVALGAMNLLVWGPRLRRGIAAVARLRLTVLSETALFAIVLGATAFLTALAPPAQASAAAFDQTQRVDGVRIELLTATSDPGRNRFVVRVHEGLTAVTNAERVALRFTMVEHDMGVQELVAEQRAPGEYVAEGSPTAMFGTWKIDTSVRLPGRLDIHALFTVPIASSGQVARLISVAPYSLVVFTEPSQPAAGAPVTINIVLIDAKGDPVQGKTVRASFDGPATQSPIAATENAQTQGPGRYVIAVPALDAGTWKVTLSVGTEGSGAFTLQVAR